VAIGWLLTHTEIPSLLEVKRVNFKSFLLPTATVEGQAVASLPTAAIRKRLSSRSAWLSLAVFPVAIPLNLTVALELE